MAQPEEKGYYAQGRADDDLYECFFLAMRVLPVRRCPPALRCLWGAVRGADSSRIRGSACFLCDKWWSGRKPEGGSGALYC